MRPSQSAQAKATGLAGRFTQLKNAVGDLQEFFGEIIARSLNLGESTGGLVEKIRALTARLEANKEEWVRWGQLVVVALKTAASGIFNFQRIVVNVADIIREVLVAAVASALGAISALLNRAGDGVNVLIEGLNKIPGVDIEFRIGDLPVDRFFTLAQNSLRAIPKDVDDIGDALKTMGESARTAFEAFQTVLGGGSLGGTSSEVADAANGLAGSAAGGSGGGGAATTRTPGAIATLPAALRESLLILNQLEPAFQKAGEAAREMGEEAVLQLTSMERLAVTVADRFADSLVDATEKGLDAFRGFVSGVLKELGRLAARFGVFKILGAVLGPGNAIVQAFGNLAGFGGARASGGPVSPGQAFLVGERGPELFMPSTAGRIIPNVPTAAAPPPQPSRPLQLVVQVMGMTRDDILEEVLLTLPDMPTRSGYTVRVPQSIMAGR